MRIQFYAFEIARNKEGLNSMHFDRSKSRSPSPALKPVDKETRNKSRSPEPHISLTEEKVIEKGHQSPTSEKKGKATRKTPSPTKK